MRLHSAAEQHSISELVLIARMNRMGVCFGGTDDEPSIGILRANGLQRVMKGPDFGVLLMQATNLLDNMIEAEVQGPISGDLDGD